MAAGQDRAENLPKPYHVIIIPLGWEQDGTGEAEECCFAAALAKTQVKEASPNLGLLWERLVWEWEGQPGSVEGEMQKRCMLSVTAALLGGYGRYPTCRLLVP